MGDLLFYDGKKGESAFYTVTNSALKKVKEYKTWSKSWKKIIPVNLNNDRISDLIFYDLSKGHSSFYTLDAKANLAKVKAYKTWRKSWNILVPGEYDKKPGTDILFYQK